MSLIDRYVAEIGRHLPEKDRADIEAEIRSTLEDVIEEKIGQTGEPVTQAVVADVLEEFGDPVLLSQKYSSSRRYLIGPRWYDLYMGTLKRVLSIALPIFLTGAWLIALANQPVDVIGSFLRAMGDTVTVGLLVCFWVTLGFIIAEREDVQPYALYKKTRRVWTPDQLPPMPKKRQMSFSEVISSIVLVMGGAGVMALSPQILRIQNSAGPIPFLHPDLWNVWLPIFFVLTGLTMIHELFKLKIGNWTRALTITNVILGLVSIAYIVTLITTQEFINPAFLAALNEGSRAGLGNITTWAAWSVGITAAVIIGIHAWDMIHSVRLAMVLVRQKTDTTGKISA